MGWMYSVFGLVGLSHCSVAFENYLLVFPLEVYVCDLKQTVACVVNVHFRNKHSLGFM